RTPSRPAGPGNGRRVGDTAQDSVPTATRATRPFPPAVSMPPRVNRIASPMMTDPPGNNANPTVRVSAPPRCGRRPGRYIPIGGLAGGGGSCARRSSTPGGSVTRNRACSFPTWVTSTVIPPPRSIDSPRPRVNVAIATSPASRLRIHRFYSGTAHDNARIRAGPWDRTARRRGRGRSRNVGTVGRAHLREHLAQQDERTRRRQFGLPATAATPGFDPAVPDFDHQAMFQGAPPPIPPVQLPRLLMRPRKAAENGRVRTITSDRPGRAVRN